jgi:hypothetical protein
MALWLDANDLGLNDGDPVSTWENKTNTSLNATATTGNEPTLQTNEMNGYPVLDFESSNNQFFTVPNDATINPEKISIIVVGKYTNSSVTWAPFVIKTTDGDWTDGYGIARDNGNEKMISFVNHYSQNAIKKDLGYNDDHIVSMVYDKSNVISYYNGVQKGSDSYTASISNSSNKLYLGAGPNYTNSSPLITDYLDGEIAEVLLISEDISEVQRIILHNYLSAKYGISIGSSNQDYYTQDNSGSGNFDHHVAGIGKAPDGSEQTYSRGTGIVSIKAETSLSSNDYLFWGEDQKDSDYTFSTSSTDYMDRLSSIWRVSTNNSPGAVTLSIDASELDLSGMSSCAELQLAVSNSSNFQSKTTYSLTLVDGEYVANNVSFNNGDYFSFEYQDVVVIDQNGFINGNGSSNAPNTADECYKLLIKSNANGNFNISENAHVRELEVEAGGEFTIEGGKYLIVNGDITNNGTINIAEHGSLTQNTTGVNTNSGSGTYSVSRSGNTDSYVYNIWSSPITTATLSSVFSDANPCDIWTFEESTQAWKYDYASGYSANCYGNSVTFSATDVITGGDGQMDVTRGYFIPGDLTAQRVYNGEVNNGDYNTPIKATNLGNPGNTDWRDDDWNLLGNPYPSALSAAAFWQENAIDNNRIRDGLYFWDEADTAGGYNQDSDYAAWNLGGAVNSGNTAEIPLGNIASGQGFWVAAQQNTSVVFNNSMRSTTNNQFFKNIQAQNHNAWFSFVSPTNHINNILVGYNENSTDSIDHGFDAHKFVGNSPIRFASLINGDEFMIQSLAPIPLNSSKHVPLVVFTNENGTHTFTNYKRENLANGFKIYLRDKLLGIDFDLGTGDYQVDLVANTTYTSRFELVFKNLSPKADGHLAVKDGNISKPNLAGGVTSVSESEKSTYTLAY